MKLNRFEKMYINSPFHAPAQIRVVNFLRRVHEVPPGGRVVEIGCGRGVGMQLIVRAFRPAFAEALDIDPKMVRLAERRLRSLKEIPVTVRQVDVHRMPYPDGSIDAIFDFGVLHHLENWEQGLAEVARVLKPEGCFYIEEYFPALYANEFFGRLLAHPTEDRFQGPDFRAALEETGFRLLEGRLESRYRLLGVAVKEASGGRVPSTKRDGS